MILSGLGDMPGALARAEPRRRRTRRCGIPEGAAPAARRRAVGAPGHYFLFFLFLLFFFDFFDFFAMARPPFNLSSTAGQRTPSEAAAVAMHRTMRDFSAASLIPDR